MSDDFGTVSAKKGDRAREIARLREHYKNHRDTLSGLMGDAPSDHLANEYQRVINEIDGAVRKIDELEGKPVAAPVKPAAASPADTNPMMKPGTRPLVRPAAEPAVSAPAARNPRALVTVMVIAAIVVLGAIAYLVWRPRSNPQPAIVEQPVTTAPIVETTPTAPPAVPASSIKITPALADYGTIRKGTRAVRQFEVVNQSANPVEIQVARSTCRCLYYDYKSKLAPNGKETITVTIDAAKAKAGDLQEQIAVTSKKDPAVNAGFTVQATIQ